ncbi:hypothetical protein ACFY48_24165 [Streptomyces coeruleorubidus]|uniref:hypothetical protein n=1 Tax=Streptomyces coeruleorubidus TaxID=116188 RepID=UPI0036770DF4
MEATGPGTSGGERPEAGTADDVPAEPGPPVGGGAESGGPSDRPAEPGVPVGEAVGSDRPSGQPAEPGLRGGESAGSGLPVGEAAESGPPADKSSEPSPPGGRPAEEDPRADKSPASDRSNGRQMGPGALADVDPTVLRLALLTRHHSASVRLEAAVLEEAGATLARWRGAVARWARRPSRPVPDEVRGRLREAWEDDLDVPRVLDELRRVENEPELPDGARFETYAYADRLLGLELTRDLGAPS